MPNENQFVFRQVGVARNNATDDRPRLLVEMAATSLDASFVLIICIHLDSSSHRPSFRFASKVKRYFEKEVRDEQQHKVESEPKYREK